MSENQTTTSSGGGLCAILFIVFLVLKLTGTVDWRWVWVMAPLWMPFIPVILILGIVALVLYVQDR